MQTLRSLRDGVSRELAEIAKRQHGVVSRRQVEGLGLAGNSIDLLIRNGRLHRLHPGVYALGHTAITRQGWWMGAVLASGEGTVLSHQSAAGLWGIWGSGAGETHVTVPRKTRSQRSIHRHFSMLPDDERTVLAGIPTTSAARAVLDLAATKGAAAESALREMEYLQIYGPVSLPALLERHPHHKGTPIVRTCLERLAEDPSGRIRSDLEELFLPFLDANQIPRPRLNAWISIDDDRFQVDCLWADAKLIGELDGFKSHGTKRAFRKDRRRDRRLGARGFHVVRITEDQLLAEADEVAADLKALIYKRP
jgi:hypothetical protein